MRFLYCSSSIAPLPFPEDVFIELMGIATKSVSFSFNETMFRQIEGVSMGSPLGPILVNIFVGFHERHQFDRFPKPFIYLRYVDDTFVPFKSRSDALVFFDTLNQLHSSLSFTIEEENGQLPFLDVFLLFSHLFIGNPHSPGYIWIGILLPLNLRSLT